MRAGSKILERPLVDSYARPIDYIRLSVTDRCDFRCVYCMSENMNFLPRSELLSLEEMARLAQIFVARGVKKIRITGGEPLVRRNVMSLFRALGALHEQGLRELALTTNGARLKNFAAELFACGVRRVNVSLDTLDAEKFRKLTRWGDFCQVMEGIGAARDAGLKVKINCVALKGVNEDEFVALTRWAHGEGHELTFIEAMPLGDDAVYNIENFMSLDVLREQLERELTLAPSPHRSGGPARYVEVAETGGRVGLISPLSQHFCDSCNRVRVTCSGVLYTCLGQDDRTDLRGPLRAGADDAAVMAALDDAMRRKPRGHDFVEQWAGTQAPVHRAMSATGG